MMGSHLLAGYLVGTLGAAVDQPHELAGAHRG